MGKYLKLFEEHADYEEYINSGDAILPNVSYCKDVLNQIHYNQYVRDYSKEYFTTELLADNSTITFRVGANVTNSQLRSISYSTDDGATWNTNSIPSSSHSQIDISVTGNAGDKILWKGDGIKTCYQSYYVNTYWSDFSCDKAYKVYGNIMSLLYFDDFYGVTEFQTNTTENFYSLFEHSVTLTDTSNLVLPATTLTNYCYYSMFNGCTSLVSAPELPATTLANSCYQIMFQGCISLVSAPELPATTLTNSCYSNMFNGCTSLVSAPELPATTLANYCYLDMFQGCTSLVSAPELPVTTLANFCYQGMFHGCTSLTTAPELPATTLTDYCYANMFNGCTSLTTAPELPATTLVSNSYLSMFNGCTSLNYIKAMFTTTPSTSYTSNWVQGVASTGTFVKNSAATWDVTGQDGIPTGWTVETV